MIQKHQVVEFDNIDKLNQFLDTVATNRHEIKKIFRSPDGIYFVWYTFYADVYYGDKNK